MRPRLPRARAAADSNAGLARKFAVTNQRDPRGTAAFASADLSLRRCGCRSSDGALFSFVETTDLKSW